MRWTVLLATLLAGTAAARALPTVLVLPLDNATGRATLDGLAEGSADLLTACLSAHADQVAVVDREALAAQIDEQALGRERYLAERSLAEIGRLSGASHLVRGSFTAAGAEVHVEVLLFEIATTRLAHGVEAEVAPEALAAALCERVAPDLAGQLAGVQPGVAPLTGSAQPEREQRFIEGIGHYYNGDLARAMPAFIELLQQAPDDPHAQYWLGRSFHAAGLSELAQIQLQAFVERHPEHPGVDRAKRLLAGTE
jgi:TolA-binding protein